MENKRLTNTEILSMGLAIGLIGIMGCRHYDCIINRDVRPTEKIDYEKQERYLRDSHRIENYEWSIR